MSSPVQRGESESSPTSIRRTSPFSSATRLDRLGVAGSWFIIGQAFGFVASFFVPEAIITQIELTSCTGALAAALYGIGVLRKWARPPLYDVQRCLRNAQLLFVRNLITDRQYEHLQWYCLRKPEEAPPV
jgi:hypothetical protein